MLTYKVTATFSDGTVKEFTVTAHNDDEAIRFGRNTAKTIMANMGKKCVLKHINVEEYYDE